jgi:glycosyltransferase involved in cell wall biosynthesis
VPKVLVVAYYFPPIGGIGSIRLKRFAELLPQSGWQPTVLAPRDTPHPSDQGLSFPEEHVVRSPSIELSRVGRTALAARSTDSGSPDPARQSLRGALRQFAHRYVFFPDAQIGWYPGAVRAGKAALKRESFDAIYSSSFPISGHLVARTLARHSGLPWVAEYRDPWSDALPRDHPYRRRAQALERAIAREATTVVMPTRTWAAHYGSVWGTDIAVLPNGLDTQLPAGHAPERPTLTHVGSYYPGEHDLSALWQALARLRERSSEDLPRIRFVGNLPEELRREVADWGLGDVFESTGFVSHEEAMRELMSATMLIASGIRGADARRRGWVPAKIFEYLASGLPVLYVADATSDAAHILAGHAGVHLVAPGDVDGALAAVQVGLGEAVRQRDVSQLSREAGARKLAQILDAAVGPHPQRSGRREAAAPRTQ